MVIAPSLQSRRHRSQRPSTTAERGGRTLALPAIHPGEILAGELDELGLSAGALARALDVPTNRVTEILNAKRAITADTALRLARFFGASARFWLNLQTSYDLAIADKTSGAKIAKTVRRRAA